MIDWTFILTGMIVFFTFTVEGIAGFGSTIMALPFVIMLIGLNKAVPLLSSLNLLLALFLICRSWRNIDLKEYFFIVVNVSFGVLAGLFFADYLPQKILIFVLAFFTVFVGVRGLVLTLKKSNAEDIEVKKSKSFADRLILFAGGIFQGAFSSGGPLVVMYAAENIREKTRFRATLPLLWFTTNSIMNIKFIAAGNVWDKMLLIRFCCALPFIGAGMLFGDYLHWKVEQKKFVLLVYVLLIIVAFILFGNVFFK